MLFINPARGLIKNITEVRGFTIEEASLQKFTCFQDFNLTFVEYLTHVLYDYIWKADNLFINL